MDLANVRFSPRRFFVTSGDSYLVKDLQRELWRFPGNCPPELPIHGRRHQGVPGQGKGYHALAGRSNRSRIVHI